MRLYLMPASGLNSNVVTTGPGIDLRDLSVDVELRVLFLKHLGSNLELFFVDRAVLVGPAQQAVDGNL